jgi:hypothetical protein
MSFLIRSDCCPPCTTPDPCTDCCPSQTVLVTDLRPVDGTVDSWVYSDPFPAWCWTKKTPHCTVLAGGRIDDKGGIGGQSWSNNRKCDDPLGGRISTIDADTEVTCYRDTATNRLKVHWAATSEPTCGAPTGLKNVTFRFWWT